MDGVVALRLIPCVWLASVTLAPSTTARVLSRTLPCNDVVPVCAQAQEMDSKKQTGNKKKADSGWKTSSLPPLESVLCFAQELNGRKPWSEGENSDVESSAKTDKLPGQFFVLKTLVRRCVRSQENKAD